MGSVLLSSEVMHELDNSEWVQQLNWPAGKNYTEVLQGVEKLMWDEDATNLHGLGGADLDEPALFQMGVDPFAHPYLDMMNGFRKIHQHVQNNSLPFYKFPKNQQDGGSWIPDITLPHLGVEGAFNNYQAQLFKERDMLCWTANVSCMQIGNFTKGHNHVAPVGIGACTGGRKMVFMLPPHLTTTDGRFKMKMKEVDQHKSFAAMLTAVEEYGVKAHCCIVWPQDFLYMPAGWWHWTLTLPPHPRNSLVNWPLQQDSAPEMFCIALSTYVMPCDGRGGTCFTEHVLAGMLKVYDAMGAKQKRETLNALQLECNKPFEGMSILQDLCDTAPSSKIGDNNPLARQLMKHHCQIGIAHNELKRDECQRQIDKRSDMAMNLVSAEDLDPDETYHQSIKRFKGMATQNVTHRTKLTAGVFDAPLDFDDYLVDDKPYAPSDIDDDDTPVVKVKIKTLEDEDEKVWLEKGGGTTNIVQRLLRDIKRIKKSDGMCCYNSSETVSPASLVSAVSVVYGEADVTQPWRITMPHTVFEGVSNELAEDLQIFHALTGFAPDVELECIFQPDFPSSPPFVRVIRPRFLNLTGHVTQGGSICAEILVDTGSAHSWKPTITMESLILTLKHLISVDGGGRLWLDRGCEEVYDATEAREAFRRALRTHGWAK